MNWARHAAKGPIHARFWESGSLPETLLFCGFARPHEKIDYDRTVICTTAYTPGLGGRTINRGQTLDRDDEIVRSTRNSSQRSADRSSRRYELAGACARWRRGRTPGRGGLSHGDHSGGSLQAKLTSDTRDVDRSMDRSEQGPVHPMLLAMRTNIG
jgi:hypothetical protein